MHFSKIRHGMSELGIARSTVFAFVLLLKCFHRSLWRFFYLLVGSAGFRQIGKGVCFNGHVRFARPFSDVSLGDGVTLGVGCFFVTSRVGSIRIGRNTFINDHCYMASNYSIQIGEECLIAEFVGIRDFDHEFSSTELPISQQGMRGGPIMIGDGTWICRGVIITSGVSIGKGCVIGANAVVTRDIPDWSVAVGAPARVVRSRRPAAGLDP